MKVNEDCKLQHKTIQKTTHQTCSFLLSSISIWHFHLNLVSRISIRAWSSQKSDKRSIAFGFCVTCIALQMIVIWFSNFIAYTSSSTITIKFHLEWPKRLKLFLWFALIQMIWNCCRLHEYPRHLIEVCTFKRKSEMSGQSAYQRNQQWTNSNYHSPNVSQMSNLYVSRLSLFCSASY